MSCNGYNQPINPEKLAAREIERQDPLRGLFFFFFLNSIKFYPYNSKNTEEKKRFFIYLKSFLETINRRLRVESERQIL